MPLHGTGQLNIDHTMTERPVVSRAFLLAGSDRRKSNVATGRGLLRAGPRAAAMARAADRQPNRAGMTSIDTGSSSGPHPRRAITSLLSTALRSPSSDQVMW